MDTADGHAAVEEVEIVAPVDELDPIVDAAPADGTDDSGESSLDEGSDAASTRGRKGLKVVGAVLAALLVAAAAVVVANSLSGNDTAAPLPAVVSSPGTVVDHLQTAGWDCPNVAVVDQVATCSSTVTVRVFTDADGADQWVADVLDDSTTSSAVGWVVHGNVVVAGPLTSTPELAAALGAGSRIF